MALITENAHESWTWNVWIHEELHNLYASPNIIRMIKSRMRWLENVACMGEMRNAYNILMVKPEGKRPLIRPRCRWEDSTRMAPWEIEWKGIVYMHVAQDRDQWQALVNMVMHPLYP